MQLTTTLAHTLSSVIEALAHAAGRHACTHSFQCWLLTLVFKSRSLCKMKAQTLGAAEN